LAAFLKIRADRVDEWTDGRREAPPGRGREEDVMDNLNRITAGIAIGLSALLLAGCGGTAEAEPLSEIGVRVATVIPSGPSDLEQEKNAEAEAAEAARIAAEAEAARIAAEQAAAAEAARVAAEQAAREAAAREAARVAAEQAARDAQQSRPQSNHPGGTQSAPKPSDPVAPKPAPAAPKPAPKDLYSKAYFKGATFVSCNANGTVMTYRMNFTSGSYVESGPNGATGVTLPTGEWVDLMVECPPRS
jgi:pyruvate/2-oxoglutarate dehydrogenase complex dihydrolipoamide acyltransferase (E2) component